MLPVNNLINQIFFGSYQWDIYNQRFSSSIPVDRVTGAGQTQIGYWSDSQLWQTIAWSRFAYERNPVVKGIINILIDHIGKPHVEWVGDKSLARKVSKLWEKFSRVNCLGDSGYLTTGELTQDREKEIRVRWLRDGEVFIRFFVKDVGYPLVLRFVEPEQVRTPPIDRDEKFSHTWGIVTEIDDNENIRGYWVYYPNQGEWDYVHRRYMVYGRRNADRNVKRGLPEIANLELDFAHLWQLLRGVTITSKAQASIAWIEKYPGAMLEQILAHSISTKDTGTTSFGPFKPGTPNLSPSFYGVDPNAKSIDPGTILSVNQGKEYEPGPTSDPQKYIDACASILHLLSLQWCLPDWITKGPEAYASALVSGSPFVRRIESMQADYAAIFGQVCTTFVRLAERLGWLERKTLQKVQPVVRLPSVIMADEIKQVETLQKELQSGLLSEIEYLHKRGRDPRKTLSQRKKWRELLSKYGVGETQQGVSEDKEETKPKKFRDYLNPPGSRILREECEKKDFEVMKKLTGECETVQRCKDWEPGDKSPYVLGCKHGDRQWKKTSTGNQPNPSVSKSAKNISQRAIKLMEEIYAQASNEKKVDHNKRQQLMGQVTHLSSSVVTLGFLEDLSSYPAKVKREVIKQLAIAVQGDDKANKLFITKEVESASDDKLDKLIAKAIKVVKGEIDEIQKDFTGTGQQDDSKEKKKSASAPILDIIAQTAIDSLKDSVGKGEKITLPPGIPGKQEIEYAMSRMNFTPDNIAQFLGGAMTLGSIEHQMQEHQKVMLRSSLLKTLAGRIPYLQEVQVDKKLSEFAFESFVAVNEKAYARIIGQIKGIIDHKIPTPKLLALLHRVTMDCPNIYGEIKDNREIRSKLIKSINQIQDEGVKRKVMESILLRCVFSYGTAEIARRGNEEAWAKTHGAGMAYNPQFPGVDNVLTINKDGVYHIIPMSHKMHMTEGSNTASKEFAKMKTINDLIAKHKGRVEKRVQISLRQILRSKPGERLSHLNRYIDRLESKLKKYNCYSVDWGSSSSNNRDICFKLDYSRMILSSLSKHIEDMPSDGYKGISYKPITLVRFRAKNIEFHVEDSSKAIAIYTRRDYENREEMIKNSIEAIRQGLGKEIKPRKRAQPKKKANSSSNSSQVQQPKT